MNCDKKYGSLFVLIRVLGNDLPPRHSEGQTLRNLEFILEHEKRWPEVSKRWIVNRIWDREQESRITASLESNGEQYDHIPFDIREYSKISLAYSDSIVVFSPQYRTLIRSQQARSELHSRRHRVNYAINNNGGRMAALRQGRKLAQWILPWDGNCFLTDGAWIEIKKKIQTNSHLPYFVVPMARLPDNRLLLDNSFRPVASEEPQVIFRHDAEEEFDIDRPYGRRPKVDLLWRLGVPGPWDQFEDDPWDPPRPALAREAGQFAWAGWVARLDSGQERLEKPTKRSGWRRGAARNGGIIAALDKLDAESIASLLPRGTLFINNKSLEAASNIFLSGPTPYPQPITLLMGEAQKTAEKKSKSLCWNFVGSTLAWKISSMEKFGANAAEAFRLSQRISFSLPIRHGGSRIPQSEEELLFYLEAMKLIQMEGFLNDSDLVRFRSCLERNLQKWTEGWLGIRRSHQPTTQGLRQDLKSALVAAYLCRHDTLAAVLRRTCARFAWHLKNGEWILFSSNPETRRLCILIAFLAECAGFPGLLAHFRSETGDLSFAVPADTEVSYPFWFFTHLSPALSDGATVREMKISTL